MNWFGKAALLLCPVLAAMGIFCFLVTGDRAEGHHFMIEAWLCFLVSDSRIGRTS